MRVEKKLQYTFLYDFEETFEPKIFIKTIAWQEHKNSSVIRHFLSH